MKKMTLFLGILSMYSFIFPMELARKAPAVQEQSIDVNKAAELRQILSLDPTSQEFSTLMRQLDAARMNFDDCDALIWSYIKLTTLLNNAHLHAPHHATLMSQINSLRETLFRGIVYHYRNDQAAIAAVERYASSIPNWQHYIHPQRTAAHPVVLYLRESERDQILNRLPLFDQLRDATRSPSWSSRLLLQVALLWLVFRQFGTSNNNIVDRVKKMLGYSVRWKDGGSTGPGSDFVRPALQLLLFSGGQAILSRHTSNVQRIFRTLLPSALFGLAYGATHSNLAYVIMADFIRFIQGPLGPVSTSYYEELATAISMLGTIASIAVYENYESIKRLLSPKKNDPAHLPNQ